MFAPFSTKLMERVWKRCEELLIDESNIKLRIVTDDRLMRTDHYLNYTGEANLALVNFVDSLTVFISKACLNLAFSLQECWMIFKFRLFLFFLFRLCAWLAEDRVDRPFLLLVFLNIKEAESRNQILVTLYILLGETTQEVFLLEPFGFLNIALMRLTIPIEKHT